MAEGEEPRRSHLLVLRRSLPGGEKSEAERSGRKRARLLESLTERCAPANIFDARPVPSSEIVEPRILSLPLPAQRNLLTVCLEEHESFPRDSLRGLWSSLDESGTEDSWVTFLREMAAFQHRWTPAVTPTRRSTMDCALQDGAKQRRSSTMMEENEDVRGTTTSDEQKGREWEVAMVTTERDEVQCSSSSSPLMAIVDDVRRRLQRLEDTAAPVAAQEMVEHGCREALRHLLHHDGVGAGMVCGEKEWAALGLEQRGDGLMASLCRAVARDDEETGSVRNLRGFLEGGLLGRLARMQSPASRVLAEGIEAVVKRRPRVFVDAIILPLLMQHQWWGGEEGPGWAQCEICLRLIKKGALQQADLEYLLSSLCATGAERAYLWDDSILGIITSILGCQPPLSDHTMICLLERLESTVEATSSREGVGRGSLKVVGLVNSLIRRYRPRLVTHRCMLERVADKSGQALIRAAVAKLK